MRCGIKEKDIRDFEKYANKLADVMHRILSYNPDAMAFLDNGDSFVLYGDGIEYDRIADGVFDRDNGITEGLEAITAADVMMGEGFGCGALG